MKTDIAIQTTPAKISFDFDAIRKDLEKHLEKYDVVVTADTVADAKKMATDLNKQAKDLDDKRKAAIAKVSAPINEADDQLKELVGLFKDGRVRILDQVKTYEDETRALAGQLLEERRQMFWNELGVKPEFYKAEFDDLAQKLTSVTGTGNLSAAARNELERRCTSDAKEQAKVERRLLELEVRSFRAGLKEPLTKDHVSHFLKAEDEAYEQNLARILEAEVGRQERIEEAERERQAKEAERAKQKADAEREIEERRQAEENRQAEAAGEEPPNPEPEPTKTEPEPAAPAPDGQTRWLVTCTFDTACASRIPQAAIEKEIRRVLDKAGITTLSSVTAEKVV